MWKEAPDGAAGGGEAAGVGWGLGEMKKAMAVASNIPDEIGWCSD